MCIRICSFGYNYFYSALRSYIFFSLTNMDKAETTINPFFVPSLP